MTRARLALLVALTTGCTCGAPAASPAPAPPPPPPPEAPPSPPPTLALGLDGTPVTVDVEASPGVTFELAQATEIQIDATAETGDPEVTVYDAAGLSPLSDGDGGEGHDARAVGFLRAGRYVVRVFDRARGDLVGHVRVSRPPALPSAGTLAPDVPVDVDAPAAESERESQVELGWTLAEARHLALEVTPADAALCQPSLTLVRDGSVLATTSGVGPTQRATIDRAFEPGAYALRVRDSAGRACAARVVLRPVE